MNTTKRTILSLLILVSWFGSALADDNSHVLRNPKTACGFYLARFSSEFNGRRITEDLDVKKLKDALAKDFDPAKERVVAVGAPPDWLSRRKLRKEITRALDDAGFPAAKHTEIRHIGHYLESKVGVFASIPGKGLQRLADLDEKNMGRILDGAQVKKLLDEGGSIVIAGTPLIGPSRAKIKASVESTLRESAQSQGLEVSDDLVRTRSRMSVWARAFWENPKQAYLDAWHGFRAFFPYSEDLVTPTEGEKRTMAQKVTMHTIFSMISFAMKGETMQVMVPMTVVNGANSGVTGTYRSTLGNWMSRNGDSTALRTLKGMMLSSFFTFDLHLAKNAFNHDVLHELTSFAGWNNFIAGAWVTVMFQSMWRTPVSTVLHSWERWKSETGGPDASATARNVAGNAEKFMTYLMTQFYIVSIVVQSSFFKLVWNEGGGFGMLSGDPLVKTEMGQTLLMNFNVGHLSMAVVGLAAFALKSRYKLFDKLVPAINWADKVETKGYQGVINVFKRTFSFFRPIATGSPKDLEPKP